jgi:hypothetical protein
MISHGARVLRSVTVVQRLWDCGERIALSIVLVYPPGDDAEASADAADELAEAVKETCEARLTDKTQIIIKHCIAISEDDLPVSRARVLTHWRLEHMTLKADGNDPGPISA